MANIILASEYNVRQCDRVYSDYRLKLSGIFCTDCDDACEEAEMFGWVGFLMSESANWEKLWNASEASVQRVWPDIGGNLIINSSTDFTLTHATNESYIILGGHLYEDDTYYNDDLGFNQRVLYLP